MVSSSPAALYIRSFPNAYCHRQVRIVDFPEAFALPVAGSVGVQHVILAQRPADFMRSFFKLKTSRGPRGFGDRSSVTLGARPAPYDAAELV